MEYMRLTIKELHELLKLNKVTTSDLIKESLDKSHMIQNKYNALITILDDVKSLSVNDNILSGIPYGVSDLFSTKDILTTGSSNALKDYIPFFNATVIDKLNNAGSILINKTVCDEFGIDGKEITSYKGIVKNPWDENRICGSFSNGSACAVSAGVYPFALGTDTGGGLRKSAADCGIVGYKPTYGMVSRYGVLPYVSSLDHIGVYTRSIEDAAIVIDNIKGIDKNDMTTWDSSNINLKKSLNGDIKNKKLCYIKELCDINEYKNPSEELKEHLLNFKNKIDMIKKKGLIVDEVSVDKKLLKLILPTYDIISCAEATSNMSNLTSLVFGPRGDGDNYIDIMKNYRTKNFSSLVKRRLTIGSYVLKNENKEIYFKNARKG